jgi:hypothetical protein
MRGQKKPVTQPLLSEPNNVMPTKLICPATLPGNFLANVHQTTWTFFAGAMAKTMLKNVRECAWQIPEKSQKSTLIRDSKKRM